MIVQADAAKKLKKRLEESGKALVPVLDGNLVDAVWGAGIPPPPDTRIRVHRMEFAGQSVSDKLAAMRSKLEGASLSPSRPRLIGPSSSKEKNTVGSAPCTQEDSIVRGGCLELMSTV